MPLLWPAFGMALGIFAGAHWDFPVSATVLLLIAVAGGWLLARSGGLPLGFAALFAAGLLLGVLRAGAAPLGLVDDLAPYHAPHTSLTGVVEGLPESVGSRVRFQMRVSAVESGGQSQSVDARVLVWTASPPRVEERRYPYLLDGDEVVVTGRLGPPERFGGFDYPEHLAAQGIGAVLSNASIAEVVAGDGALVPRSVHALRRNLVSGLASSMPEPQAALTQALLLGIRGGMPAEVGDDFRRAGMAHLLAVSGMHVGLVLALSLMASTALVGRHRRAYLLPPLALLWIYVLLAGAPPSAVRAAAMGSVFLLALATGRASAAFNALGLIALVMLAWEPRVLWDRSFQLSFAAMAGVLAIGLPSWQLVEPRFRNWKAKGASWAGLALARWLVAGVLVSIGATLGSLPLVALNFQQVPLLGIPATLLALPLLPALLVSGAIAAAVGALVPALALAVSWVPALIGGAVVFLAEFFGGFAWSAWETDAVGASEVWVAYAFGFAVLAIAYHSRWLSGAAALAAAVWRGPSRPVHAALLLSALAVTAAAPWVVTATSPDGHLRVHFLDVGQGDSTLIVTPGGGTVLIDGGPDPRVTLGRMDSRLPPNRHTVGLAVLTHPHDDHANGLLELARRDRVERILVPPPLPGAGGAWLDEMERTSAQVIEAGAGQVLELEDGVRLEVLYPPDPPMTGTRSDVDNNGVALRLVHGKTAALFTGDLFTEGEAVLIDSGVDLSAQVLKLGHHGSGTSTSEALLDAVRPSAAVVSAGDFDQHGHPAPEVVERLLRHVPSALVFQTSAHGTITFTSDGSRWWADTAR